LAIIVIDDISNPGVDLLTMSNEFHARGIIWVIVGVRTPRVEICNFYHTVARHTGRNKSFINIFSNYL
jgi:hypothetical protein